MIQLPIYKVTLILKKFLLHKRKLTSTPSGVASDPRLVSINTPIFLKHPSDSNFPRTV